MMVRWPATVEPGMRSAEIISQEDWLPTLLTAAGSETTQKTNTGRPQGRPDTAPLL